MVRLLFNDIGHGEMVAYKHLAPIIEQRRISEKEPKQVIRISIRLILERYDSVAHGFSEGI